MKEDFLPSRKKMQGEVSPKDWNHGNECTLAQTEVPCSGFAGKPEATAYHSVSFVLAIQISSFLFLFVQLCGGSLLQTLSSVLWCCAEVGLGVFSERIVMPQ
ncbi:unnamed protein product [Ostreobium quekettii]|uniref:Uncharacterized protein n=1 Tax=Ostreobium quekettii TaxID=121088 RepID=A0A8S1INX8_9CHLO|nr:unnamed protein product [Ostreobium quekettii]